jgi:hypothetical protein
VIGDVQVSAPVPATTVPGAFVTIFMISRDGRINVRFSDGTEVKAGIKSLSMTSNNPKNFARSGSANLPEWQRPNPSRCKTSGFLAAPTVGLRQRAGVGEPHAGVARAAAAIAPFSLKAL